MTGPVDHLEGHPTAPANDGAVRHDAGQKITFRAFLPYGALVTFESLVIATIYMWLPYLA